jgi:hypothetical protein
MSEPTYVGTELELFAEATIWKSYLARQIAPRPGEEVLEVGAGLGGTTRQFCNRTHSRWLCLEPDPALAAQITRSIARGDLPACCRVEVGTIASLGDVGAFDTILYIDVLEHIEDDRGELERAARLLKPVVTLPPSPPPPRACSSPAGGSSHSRRPTSGSSRRSTRRSGTTDGTRSGPSPRSDRRGSTWSGWSTSTRSACSHRWPTSCSSTSRSPTRSRSPSGTGCWSGCRPWLIR